MQLENLESRRLLSAVVEGTVLTVTGRNRGDVITVNKEDNSVVVRLNRSLQVFPNINRVVIDARRGNDLVDCSDLGSIPLTVFGGQGNDTILGSSGDDLVTDMWGKNTIVGGDGDDTFIVRGKKDVINGGAGRDEVNFSTKPPPQSRMWYQTETSIWFDPKDSME